MTYVSSEARESLLHEVAAAIDEIAVALAALGVAYEALDETTGDRLEEALFRPVQTVYGRAQRTYTGFAQRVQGETRPFGQAVSPAPSAGVAGLVERAVTAIRAADDRLSVLQDTMLPVEVGDPELRAGLADVRERLAAIPAAAREFGRTLGR